jgi:hypothetical protein
MIAVRVRMGNSAHFDYKRLITEVLLGPGGSCTPSIEMSLALSVLQTGCKSKWRTDLKPSRAMHAVRFGLRFSLVSPQSDGT